MKFSDMSCHAIRSTPVKTLSGIARPMTTVGRRVLSSPRGTVGFSVSMNAKTTVTAKQEPEHRLP